VSVSTYASPFLQSSGGQQAFPWQQPPGFDQLQLQYGFGQQPFGQQPFGQGQQPFGGQVTGSSGPGVDQILPTIQVIVALLGSAQQAISTAQHMAAQMPVYVATAIAQPYHQLTAQRAFPQLQRPYSMAW
jgi:hypothetical protein